jgi:hypothetical protein
LKAYTGRLQLRFVSTHISPDVALLVFCCALVVCALISPIDCFNNTHYESCQLSIIIVTIHVFALTLRLFFLLNRPHMYYSFSLAAAHPPPHPCPLPADAKAFAQQQNARKLYQKSAQTCELPPL